MEEKLKKLESELKAIGINSVDELNEAIKKEKLDISLMVAPIPGKMALAGQGITMRKRKMSQDLNEALGAIVGAGGSVLIIAGMCIHKLLFGQEVVMRVSEIDKMIATLESLERVDKTADYHKSMAIAYLKNFADCLDDKGVKTIKKRPEAATSKDANT